MEVLVQPYDAEWPGQFEAEALSLRQALGGQVLALHHIGSTAIVGIHAKPVIDMLLVVAELSELDGPACAQIHALGYEVMGEFGIAGRRYFRKTRADGRRSHQLHSFALGSAHIDRHLAFRDYMNAHGDAAQTYSALKQRLAAAHPDDMAAYMDGKDGFIQEQQRLALSWRQRQLAPEA